jgi:hypothetical protein
MPNPCLIRYIQGCFILEGVSTGGGVQIINYIQRKFGQERREREKIKKKKVEGGKIKGKLFSPTIIYF